ncbi:mannose-1-phosphate guanylyltransferase/mannose-6-phosphate isomerase [Providencia stuartii]|nr:mannose-1-phosphate guanylyltransferase/mannose-6-phosphate isomerase [Providencia stuartii]EMD5260128.1 mannose-1-phosphate guanylyltransferase/mannose-6-phosphate isomerase [Providencia stuartii]
MKSVIPVILAGGSGSRLWPMSRSHYPKQFLSLASENSLLQETLLRLNKINPLPANIICNEEHRFIVAEQLRMANLECSNIILEPMGRNTAPAIALAALKTLEKEQDPILLVLPADHLISDIESFYCSIDTAIKFADQGKLVTFGIVPTSPETGFGYIKHGEKMHIQQQYAYYVDSFKEKPNKLLAEEYIKSTSYYWNSGMFMFKASRYLDELKFLRPDIYDIVNSSLKCAVKDLDFIRIDSELFSRCPDESIDHSIMEHTKDAVVVPLDAGWSDIGSWSSLWELSNKDASNNVVAGDVITDSTTNCYINASTSARLVATVGLNDLIIVDTKDALLVSHKNNAQDIKKIVNDLKLNNRKEFQQHSESYCSWGKHDLIAGGERYQVKKIIVKPGHKTTKQLHYHRSEHWVIVSGTAKVFKNNDFHIISENESIYIPVGTEHYFENPGKIPLEMIEVRTGSYLKEDDIIRISQL